MNNHALTIAFTVRSENDGENITKQELIAGLKKRISDLERNGDEIIEACGLPFDSYPEPDEHTPNELESFELNFAIVASSATQTVHILDSEYTQERIIDELVEENLFTTASYSSSEENKYIIKREPYGQKVALISDQKIANIFKQFG